MSQIVAVPRVPPSLIETLPQLPQQLEFAFSGRTLILRDVDADVVVDFMREAFPDSPPFHMTDRLYYAFTEGNARFVVLNSNHPGDDAQRAWLDGAFGNTGAKWRISFFHHPLYSSGDHARQAREIIRPALEPALVRNRVDVVFSGHDHL